MGQKKHDEKILMLTVLMCGSLWLHFFVGSALSYWYVCMVRCGRPAVFVWLYKLHTIGDHVLSHATVVCSTNVFKAGVCTLYSTGESVQCIHSLLYVLDNAVTHNTSRRTAASRFVALLVHLLTTVAWYSTWSSIVSNLHNHTNAALRPQRAM